MMRARKERGQILVFVLAVMVFGVIVITPLLAYVDISLRLFGRTEHRAAAYYVADAGVERVIGDLYQGVNVLELDYYVTPNESIKRYVFNATADLPEGEAPPPPEEELYLDPGVCFLMGNPEDPMPRGGVWNYSIFLAAEGRIKVNWAAYVEDGTGTEHCRGNISLWKGDDLIASVEDGDGDEGRLVAITLYVPGSDITEGGLYTIKFKNLSYRDDPSNQVSLLAQCFKPQGDDDYIFTGSITANTSRFIDPNGNITILAFNEDDGVKSKQVNTNTIFGDYVKVEITTNTSKYAYTFANITQGSGPHYSYDGKLQIGGYTTITERLPAGATELDDAGYDAIEAFEGVRHQVGPVPMYDNACLWHQFTIPPEVIAEGVTQIDVSWYGYQAKSYENPDDDELYLLIWNYNQGEYHDFDPPLGHRMQDAGYTWVKGFTGASMDYIIVSRAYAEGNLNTPVVTITAYIRQIPGPSAWWEKQKIEVLSWNISR